MKVPVIKRLVEQFTLEELQAAENDLLNEKIPAISIEGEDEGEQLTHAIAAINILKDVKEKGIDSRTAIKSYFERVRKSIS